MLSNSLTFAAATGGAALSGVRAPWATPIPVTGSLAASFTARRTALGTAMALTVKPAVVTTLVVPSAAQPTDIRNQYVHKTRAHAGGDGAMGPHPEREPA